MREFVRAEFHAQCSQIFLETVKPCRPGDRCNEVALGEHPGECDLSGSCILRACELLNRCDKSHIGMKIFTLKPRNNVSKIVFTEFCLCLDCASEESIRKRTKRHKADVFCLEQRQDLLFRRTVHHGIFALERRELCYGLSSGNGLGACFGKAPASDLTLANEVAHHFRDLLHRNLRVNAMKEVKIDYISLQSRQ